MQLLKRYTWKKRRTEESTDTEELSRETNTSSLSRKSRVWLSPTKGAPPLSSGRTKKKLFISFRSKHGLFWWKFATHFGGSSRRFYTHIYETRALKKTAFFARGAVFCVAILLQTSSRRPGRWRREGRKDGEGREILCGIWSWSATIFVLNTFFRDWMGRMWNSCTEWIVRRESWLRDHLARVI